MQHHLVGHVVGPRVAEAEMGDGRWVDPTLRAEDSGRPGPTRVQESGEDLERVHRRDHHVRGSTRPVRRLDAADALTTHHDPGDGGGVPDLGPAFAEADDKRSDDLGKAGRACPDPERPFEISTDGRDGRYVMQV